MLAISSHPTTVSKYDSSMKSQRAGKSTCLMAGAKSSPLPLRVRYGGSLYKVLGILICSQSLPIYFVHFFLCFLC